MKKLILTISIIFLLVSVLYTNTLATEIVIGNKVTNNTTTNSSSNNTNSNTSNNTNSNTNKINNINTTNTANKINTTSKTNSSYKNTNLPDTGSEDFVYGFVIIAGIVSAVYAYIKIKTYNI